MDDVNRERMGLPRCCSETGLFGKNMQQLPLMSMNTGFKQKKTLHVVELRVYPGVAKAISRLQNKEIMVKMQDNCVRIQGKDPSATWWQVKPLLISTQPDTGSGNLRNVD